MKVFTDDGGQADIDAVAVKDPREGFGQHSAHAQCLEYARCLFAGGAAAEVFCRDNEITGFYVFCEVRVERFKCVRSHFPDGWKQQILGSNDLICVDVVVKLEYFSHGVPFLMVKMLINKGLLTIYNH